MKKTTFRPRRLSRHDSDGHAPQRIDQPETLVWLFRAWLAMGIDRDAANRSAQQLAQRWGIR